jgi:hypothetical protein
LQAEKIGKEFVRLPRRTKHEGAGTGRTYRFFHADLHRRLKSLRSCPTFRAGRREGISGESWLSLSLDVLAARSGLPHQSTLFSFPDFPFWPEDGWGKFTLNSSKS